LLGLLTLLGCADENTGERRYVGALAGCEAFAGASHNATLTRNADVVVFTPDDGTLMLTGTLAADGTLMLRRNTQPAGKPPYVLTVSGRVAAGQATLTYVTPRCQAHGVLRLVPKTLTP
jgi:hypothetical protein